MTYPDHLRVQIEGYLETLRFTDDPAITGLEEAMRYSLLAGGKRIRPVLALATASAIGRDPVELLPLAAALELIHTYSLIHDDLPAMDDDDMRRGRPTCHVTYGEDVAILAGDGLYAEAFRHLLTQQGGEPLQIMQAAAELAAATGRHGHGRRPVHRRRRLRSDGRGRPAAPARAQDGRLIRASVECVLLIDGEQERATIGQFKTFASELGVLFQIVDDILDVTRIG